MTNTNTNKQINRSEFKTLRRYRNVYIIVIILFINKKSLINRELAEIQFKVM